MWFSNAIRAGPAERIVRDWEVFSQRNFAYLFRAEILYGAPFEYNRTIQRGLIFIFHGRSIGRFKKYPDHVIAIATAGIP